MNSITKRKESHTNYRKEVKKFKESNKNDTKSHSLMRSVHSVES